MSVLRAAGLGAGPDVPGPLRERPAGGSVTAARGGRGGVAGFGSGGQFSGWGRISTGKDGGLGKCAPEFPRAPFRGARPPPAVAVVRGGRGSSPPSGDVDPPADPVPPAGDGVGARAGLSSLPFCWK